MEEWSAHQLFEAAKPVLNTAAARALREYARFLQAQKLAVVFSLRHLSKICGVEYQMLRHSVQRRRESANYRIFPISKRSGGRRMIHAPNADLLRVQQFINQEILQKTFPHEASYAFHPSGGIRQCARQHRRAKFIFQFDLSDFFHSVGEAAVCRVFTELGYRPLLAFEMARLCTTTHLPRTQHNNANLRQKWGPYKVASELPYPHHWGKYGVLPQGAPTSPMLGNLAAQPLDVALSEFAVSFGLVYTRYADDLTFSASESPDRDSIFRIRTGIVRVIQEHGFKVNRKKTRLARSGSRKIVLGLLVDGDEPRVPRWTVIRIDRFFHAIEKFGLVSVAQHHGFDSAFGFYNHLQGLVAYLKDVDPTRFSDFHERMVKITPPWDKAVE